MAQSREEENRYAAALPGPLPDPKVRRFAGLQGASQGFSWSQVVIVGAVLSRELLQLIERVAVVDVGDWVGFLLEMLMLSFG